MSHRPSRKTLYTAAFAAALATMGFGVRDAHAIDLNGVAAAMVDINFGADNYTVYDNNGLPTPVVPIIPDPVIVTGSMTPTLTDMGPGAIVRVTNGIPVGTSVTVSPTGGGPLKYAWTGTHSVASDTTLGGIVSGVRTSPGAGDLFFTGESLTTTVNVTNSGTAFYSTNIVGMGNYSTGVTDAGSGTISILNSSVTGNTTGNSYALGSTIGVLGCNDGSPNITGTAKAASVELLGIERTATVTSGTGDAYARSSTIGVYGGVSAIATGTVTLSTIKQTASSQDREAVAGAYLSGVSAMGVKGAAEAVGAVKISNVTLKADAGDDDAVVEGDTVGVFGYNRDTSGNITGTAKAASVELSKIENTATVTSGTGEAKAHSVGIGTHGVFGGVSAIAKGTVTLDVIKRTASSQGGNANAGDNLSGVSAMGVKGVAEAGETVKISKVTLKANVVSGSGNASAIGNTVGVRGYNQDASGNITGTAKAASVELLHIERSATVTSGTGSANAATPGFDSIGTHGVYGGVSATATGTVTLDDIKRTAFSQGGNADAYDNISGVSAVGVNGAAEAGGTVKISTVTLEANVVAGDGDADASGDTVGVFGYREDSPGNITGTAKAASVELSHIERTATVMSGLGEANVRSTTVGVYGGVSAIATGTVTLDDIKQTASSQGGSALAGADLSGVSAMGVKGAAEAVGAVKISNVTLKADGDGGSSYAESEGDTVGVRGYNKDASGNITGTAKAASVELSKIEYTATVTSGTGEARASGASTGTHGVYGGVSATATGTVTLDVIKRTASSRGNAADAGSNLSGVSAVGEKGAAEAGGTVKISNVTLKADVVSGNGEARVVGNTVGVRGYSTSGGAVTGTAKAASVELSHIERSATVTSGTGGASAAAPGFDTIGTHGVYGGVSATATGTVTLDDIKRTASSQGDYADAYDNISGVSAAGTGATAEAGGAVTISDVTLAATVVSGAGSADAGGTTYGVATTGLNGTATATGDVTLTGVSRTATAQGGHAYASGWDFSVELDPGIGEVVFFRTMYDTVAGVISNDAYAGGKVTVSESRTATAAGMGVDTLTDGTLLANVADARLKAYGVYATNKATVRGDLSVTANSKATATGGAIAYEYGLAVGAASETSINVGGAASSIEATGTTYAVGLMLQPDFDNAEESESLARTITVTSPLTFSLESKAAANEYLSLERTKAYDYWTPNGMQTGDFTVAQHESLPVLEAEYLGMGKNDTVNLKLSSSGVLDNDGKAQRFFGIESVNVTGGTLSLADGSYFINQRDFDTTAGRQFGTVASDAALRSTVVTAGNGGTLRIDGEILSDITASSGAHASRFTTTPDGALENGFRLDQDYTLTLRTTTDGTALVGASGRMTASRISTEDGGTLAYEVVSSGTPGVLTAGMLHATGDVALGSAIDVRTAEVFDMAHGDSLSGHTLLTYGGSLTGFTDTIIDGFFYKYSLVDDGLGSLVLNLSRTDNDIGDLAAWADGNENVRDLIGTLDGYAYQGTFLEPFMNQLGRTDGVDGALGALRQLTGESFATGVLAGREAHRNMLGLNAGYLLGSVDALSENAQTVAELNGGFGSLCMAPASAWRLRGEGSFNRLNLSGSDGFGRYRSTNKTLMLAAEHSRGGLTLGVAGGLGWTKTRDRDFGGRTKSDDYGVIAYGRYDFDRMFVAARFGYSYSDIDSDRMIPLLNERARGDYSAKYLSAGLHAGYDVALGSGMGLTLTGGGLWQKSIARGFREGGSDLALAYSGWNGDSFELQAGASLSKRIDFCRETGTHLTPRVSVGVGYELGERGVGGTSSFAAHPSFPVFRSESTRPGRLKGVVGAGVEWQMTKNLGMTAEYMGSFRTRAVEHSARVGLSWSW